MKDVETFRIKSHGQWFKLWEQNPVEEIRLGLLHTGLKGYQQLKAGDHYFAYDSYKEGEKEVFSLYLQVANVEEGFSELLQKKALNELVSIVSFSHKLLIASLCPKVLKRVLALLQVDEEYKLSSLEGMRQHRHALIEGLLYNLFTSSYTLREDIERFKVLKESLVSVRLQLLDSLCSCSGNELHGMLSFYSERSSVPEASVLSRLHDLALIFAKVKTIDEAVLKRSRVARAYIELKAIGDALHSKTLVAA